MPDYGGWNAGPSMGSTGRFNAMSPGQFATPKPTGFWPSLFGAQQSPNGVMSTLGHGLNSGLGGLLGLLASIGRIGNSGGGVTPSAGGWSIDSNGNLIDTSSGGAASPGSGSIPSVMNPNVPSRAAQSSHVQGIPGSAMAFMGEARKRNQI